MYKIDQISKFLNSKINQLHDVISDIDDMANEIGSEYFRVVIFGSARIKPDNPLYADIYDLSRRLSLAGADIVTGGGPGIMEAANKGAKHGHPDSRSYGIHINLHYEDDTNSHVDITHRHRRFISRLDEFMRIGHAIVLAPGGIGTLLELFYTMQLLQVKHASDRPVILLGDFWNGLLEWMEEEPFNLNFLGKEDMSRMTVVSSIEEAMGILEPAILNFRKKKEDKVGQALVAEVF